MLTRDEQSTIFGGAATILGINEMLNAQLRPASIMANAPLTERVATVAEAFEKVGPALKAYATYCAGTLGRVLAHRTAPPHPTAPPSTQATSARSPRSPRCARSGPRSSARSKRRRRN